MSLTDIYSCPECDFIGSLFQFAPVVNYANKTYVCPKCNKALAAHEIEYIQGPRHDIAIGISTED